MIRVEPLDPGPLRRWWWGTTQRARLVTLACVAVFGMALTGIVLFQLPRDPTPVVAAPADAGSTSTARPSTSAPATTSPTGSAELVITVTDVPAVDLVNGADAARRPVLVKVPGIAPASTCRTEEALAAAAELLRGKQIRVPGADRAATDQNGRAVATVLLPDGRDYASTAVVSGLARTDASLPAANQTDLAAAETRAQQTGQGAWRPCATGTSAGDAPPATTTAARPTDDQQPDQPPNTQPPPDDDDPPWPPTTEPTQPDDDVQWGVRFGDPCAPEGALGVTHKGHYVVCRDGRHGLRWTWR